MEQHIRASRAQDLGLVRMLRDDGRRDAHLMATALRNLPQQGRPSEVVVPGLLDGPANVVRLANYWLRHGSSNLSIAEPRNKGRL
jgi:predicted glycosyltransferase